MGALCSKPGTVEGGHKVIGATRTLGGEGAGGKDSVPLNPRLAALEAAERRKQAVRLLFVRGCDDGDQYSVSSCRSNEGG